MASKPGIPRGPDGSLNAARGRSDTASDLRRCLATAPPSYLEGALQNPAMGSDEAVEALRNRAATSGVLVRISRTRTWLRSYEVKRGLVRHLRTPTSLARALLPQLYWKDLAELAEDPRAQAALRHHAEEVLAHRLDELSVGEKVALARRASPRVVSALRAQREPGVLRALLSNPRLLERDAVSLAVDGSVPREVLSHLASHPAWGVRYQIRISLVANPRTPIPSALRLVEGLPARDLERIAQDDAVPRIVRVRAERRLTAGSEAARRARGG